MRKKKAVVNHASATQSSRAGWRYREGNSSFSRPTPKSLGVCAAFFCDQARSNWDSVTSATQFHCPKLCRLHIVWATCLHLPPESVLTPLTTPVLHSSNQIIRFYRYVSLSLPHHLHFLSQYTPVKQTTKKLSLHAPSSRSSITTFSHYITKSTSPACT